MDLYQLRYYNKLKSAVEAIGWQLLSDNYINSTTELSFLCDKGHKVIKSPTGFHKGRRCLICTHNSPEMAELELKELLQKEGYILLGTYINNKTEVPVICPNLHFWNVTPNNFKSGGNRCPRCPTQESINATTNFFQKLAISNYKLIGSYITVSTDTIIACPNNHLSNVQPHNFNTGRRCQECRGDEFIKLAEAENYVILDKYVSDRIYLSAVCPNDHLIYVQPHSFKNGYRCAKCAGNCPIQGKERFISIMLSEGYNMYSEYINTRTEVFLKCPNQHDRLVKPYHFIRNVRCPQCPRNFSKGEMEVKNTLDKLGIIYSTQHSFHFLTSRRYDFYFIFNNNHYVIEFDGIQHFEYTPFFHGDSEGFVEEQCNDISKTFTAVYHGCNVIRISYKEIKHIEFHITQALQINYKLYTSNANLYKHILEYPAFES